MGRGGGGVGGEERTGKAVKALRRSLLSALE
jgi:hypothetical protein